MTDAIHTPVTVEEAQWLLRSRRAFCVLHTSATDCVLGRYTTTGIAALDNYAGAIVVAEINAEIHSGYVDYSFNADARHDIDAVVKNLTGRMPMFLLDVRSIFLVFRRRSGDVIARQSTYHFLEEILQFYADNLIALELYLTGCLSSLDVGDVVVVYSLAEDDSVEMTAEAMSTVRGKCDEYLHVLCTAIALM